MTRDSCHCHNLFYDGIFDIFYLLAVPTGDLLSLPKLSLFEDKKL